MPAVLCMLTLQLPPGQRVGKVSWRSGSAATHTWEASVAEAAGILQLLELRQ